MPRTRTLVRMIVLLALAIGPSACDMSSALEPEPPEPVSRPPRNVRPKEMLTSGARMPQPLR
jgi:hypothetical protein